MQNTCLEMLELFAGWVPDYLRKHPACPELQYYGTGEADHWPVQTNMNVCAALAVLGTEPGRENQELIDTALSLFRYAMRTHRTGDLACTCGSQWGYHWISVLGAERMTHGVNALMPYMTSDDLERYRRFRIAESDWRVDHYAVEAGLVGDSGKNKPESNIWNGGFIFRTLLDYPDSVRREEYEFAANSFMLNGISHAMDAVSETVYAGKPLREWHVGANFCATYSLDHHNYMNVGYSIICLSNLAMLYFNFKEKKQPVPESLFLHVEDLWRTVRRFFFADGRLLRIGGDTRMRYTYCQTYVLPALLMIQDLFGDPQAAELEKNYLQLVHHEQEQNGDGSFFGSRLAAVKDLSYFYYCRLESDPPAVLSQDVYWRRLGLLTEPAPAAVQTNPPCLWHEPLEDAYLIRRGNTIRSFVRKGGQGPLALCTVADRSDMAEWQNNLQTEILCNQNEYSIAEKWGMPIHEGFLSCGKVLWREERAYGEGEEPHVFAESYSAVAALPDGKTMLLLELARITKEITLDCVKVVNWKMPNDLYNNRTRIYRGKNCEYVCSSIPLREETVETASRFLNVDDKISIINADPEQSFVIHRPNHRQIIAHNGNARLLSSLYADEICQEVAGRKRYSAGTVLADTAIAVIADVTAEETSPLAVSVLRQPVSGMLRAVSCRGVDGRQYTLIANFGNRAAEYSGAGEIAPMQCKLMF